MTKHRKAIDQEAADNFVRSLAEKHRAAYAAWKQKIRLVIPAAALAAQAAIDRGETLERVEAIWDFTRDCKILAAIASFPLWELSRAEFENLPILERWGAFEVLEPGLYRHEIIPNGWVLIHTSGNDYGLFFRPEIEGPTVTN